MMVTMSGSFVVVGLGTDNVRYMWNGVELQGVVKMFVYRGTSVTLTVADKSVLPVAELKAYGIKVKEVA